MTIFYTLVALCLYGNVLAQIHSWGPCAQLEVQPNFNPSKFYGRWYEQERFFALYELNSKCNTFDYNPSTTTTFNLISSFASNTTQQLRSFQAAVITPDHEQPAKMLFSIPLSPVRENDTIKNLSILGTDYDKYAVVYSCNDWGPVNLQYAWILTRKQIIRKSVRAKAYEVIHKNDVKKFLFRKTEHKNCAEYYSVYRYKSRVPTFDKIYPTLMVEHWGRFATRI